MVKCGFGVFVFRAESWMGFYGPVCSVVTGELLPVGGGFNRLFHFLCRVLGCRFADRSEFELEKRLILFLAINSIGRYPLLLKISSIIIIPFKIIKKYVTSKSQ